MTKVTQISEPVPVPPPSPLLFQGGILHPDVWLWDSWLAREGDTLHLYCLALSRYTRDGAPILPAQRNAYPFHIRRFSTRFEGLMRQDVIWHDHGACLMPGGAGDGSDARNVWSGSVWREANGRFLFGYTGLRDMGADRQFLQTLCLGIGASAEGVDTAPREALSCPIRDYDLIRRAGYYLGAKESLGANTGEEGGPILAWRDPFIFRGGDGRLHMYWAAKLAPTVPAVGHATLIEDGAGFAIERLSPPLQLPDAAKFTQAEVPKLTCDTGTGRYYLLISACDRLYEGQPDSEVAQDHRLYYGASPVGPWQAWRGGESLLPGLEHLFGGTIASLNAARGKLVFIAPYTENAGLERALSFARPRELDLAEQDVLMVGEEN